MIYVRRWLNQNYILITYEDNGYDKRMYPNLVLNRLKVMEVLPLFIPHWGPNSKKFP